MTDPHARLAVALADRYRLERELGQGGMATVYLAQDMRHDRKVALKVLRPELAAVIGADRFLKEIKVTAHLQHPHILGLIDSGEADGLLYYVMPFVEGESLRDRLTREKQLPVDDAVRITCEVAGALDYAHRHGVIHRDIKPENILLHEGQTMVADFGIALAVSSAGSTRMTETGMSLGTPHYMSPEQAMGERELTARSDIYALGAVLYEMLVGEPPFTGPTAQAIVAKVVTESPRPLVPQRHTVPPHVESAALTALEKLPADRFASAAAFADALNHASAVTTVPRPGFATAVGLDARRWRQVAMAAVAVAIGAGGLAAWGWWLPRAPTAVSRFAFDLEGRDPVFFAGGTLSPDGARIAYAQASGRLMLRDLDRLEAVPVPGGEIGLTPFFSPDGGSLAFLTAAPGDLRVVPVGGGAATTLVRDSAYGAGGAWSADGWLYFVGGTAQALLRVRATGGPPELVARPDTTRDELFFNTPELLPGGRAALITIMRRSGSADIAAVDLGSGAVTVLTRGLRALYSRNGTLIVLGSDGVVQAVRLDPRSLRLEGRPVTVLQGVAPGSVANGVASFALSNTGTLLYETEQPAQQVVRVNREGSVQVIDPNWAGVFTNLSLSPNGRRLAVSLRREGRLEVWVRELATGTLTRFAYEGTYSYRASWTPDGRSLLFISDRSGRSAVYQALADGGGSPVLVRADPRAADEAELSRDGRWLVYRTGSGGGRDIYALRPGLDSAPVPLVTTAFEDHSPVLSPDGRWLAYVSDESGRPEVYVRPFPNVRVARWQISRAGGAEPVWAHSGRELFYRSGSGDFVAAAVTPGPSFQVTSERVLFPTRDYFYDGLHASYTVSPDDRSFLFVRLATGAKSQAVVVLNWLEELRAKMAQ
jgi:eukaryotic-like serine/threonine-protein kinase